MKRSSPKKQWIEAKESELLAAHDAYSDGLFRHCLLRVRDREVAKDLVQESFSRAWLYLAEGKKIDHMRAFLYRIAHNLIVDYARKKKASSLDALIDEDGFEPADENIREPLDTPALRRALSLLHQLDEGYRVVVMMRFFDELSPKEIAKSLGISENVVSVRLHRAIEKLRKSFE